MLQELNKLYQSLAKDEKVPVAGRSKQRISYVLQLNKDGSFFINDLREPNAKGKMFPLDLMVLGDTKPPGAGINPCFLWDNSTYQFGYQEENAERAVKCFEAGKTKYLALEQEIRHEGYSLFCRFLEHWSPEMFTDYLADGERFLHNGVIKIEGQYHYLHEDPAIVQWWYAEGQNLWTGRSQAAAAAPLGQCLITGEELPLARLHEPSIKGVMGAQSSGAKIVSFNNKSFESYGKDQSYNAPVSEQAAFAYCNALNYLLSSTNHRMRIGDATIAYWSGSEKEQQFETNLFKTCIDPDLMSTPQYEEDDATNKRVLAALESMAYGKPPREVLDDPDSPFFILALSGNAARLSVRFYLKSTLGEMLTKIQQHNRDLELQRRHEKFKDPQFISPFRILRETVRDSKDTPPIFSGALMRAILNGSPYPDVIAHAIIRRIRVDKQINYVRCSFLKAWLTRRNPQPIITPMLDPNNTEIGYVLGRLFAALLKTQEDGSPNLNRTIKDTFYASAATSPRLVFPRLMKLYVHHIGKLEGGHKVNREKLIQSIICQLDADTAYPAQMNHEQQGRFDIGFYHQTQDFYTSK